MAYPVGAVERAMKVQEVILRALSGQLTWLQAADVLGRSPRSIRRLRWRYEHYGYDGLVDRRRQTPSPKRAPVAEVERMLHLYRAHYQGFNVRHFLRKARRDHGIPFCYAFVKQALQGAGLVPKHRARGRHRRRRAPRPCFGELLHLDGSPHVWLRRCPDERQILITVVDDATTRLLYAQLWPGETTAAVFTALHAVCTAWGLPMALYTDRARWAFHTPKAGGPVDRTHRTQVGRALDRLGIEHIGAYSPQARGRSERLNRTVQGRLVNELALAGITTLSAANAYLTERFVPDYNEEFAHPPADATSAFVQLHGVDLDAILCEQAERTVGQDNVVTLDDVPLQLDKQPGRPTCAGLRVTVRRDVHGVVSVWHGARCFGRYDGQGHPLAERPQNARAHLAQDQRSRPHPTSAIPPAAPSRRRP